MSELIRAKLAFDQVAQVKDLEDYKRNVKKMPMMIQVNGLAQTVSFYQTKGDSHIAILKHLYKHLLSQQLITANSRENLVAVIVNLESNDYRIVTTEIMAYLQWLKRFADGRQH